MVYFKKNLNILILQLLEKYTDENNSIMQKDLVRLLNQEHGIEVDRKTIKNNIEALKELDYEVETDKDGYKLLTRKFDDAELRVLIDSVLYSKSISKKQGREIIGKLKNMSSKYFSPKVSHAINITDLNHTASKNVMYAVNEINEAINADKMISFRYNKHNTQFKLVPKNDILYLVSPYQMAVCNGFYYLIGNYNKYNNISHYRIDKMSEVKILDNKRKDIKSLDDVKGEFSLPTHMAEHLYMFSGESVHAIIKAKGYIFDELIDWFGNDFRIMSESEEDVVIKLKCNKKALFYWALQYGTCAEVLEPEGLRIEIRNAVEDMCKKYEM